MSYGAAGRAAWNAQQPGRGKASTSNGMNGQGTGDGQPQGASDDEIEKILGQGKYAKKSASPKRAKARNPHTSVNQRNKK
jgi:hypothetical protein